MNELPHKYINNYDQNAPPIYSNPLEIPDLPIIKSEIYINTQQNFPEYMKPFPNDIQGEQQLAQSQLSQKEQEWLRVSINMNPFAFVQPELFMSANVSLKDTQSPVACVLVFIFKFIILFAYLMYPYMNNNHVLLFEIIMFFSSIDFWIVKNICGRILLGLKWWIDVPDQGKEQWVFETRLYKIKTTEARVNYRIFWFTQLFMFFMFVGLFIVNLFSGEYNLGISLSLPAFQIGFNLWAFNMCNKVKKTRMAKMVMTMSQNSNLQSIKLPMKIE